MNAQDRVRELRDSKLTHAQKAILAKVLFYDFQSEINRVSFGGVP